MAKKVDTVKKEVKERVITLFHVYVGSQPVQTFENDGVLAQHYAAEEKAKLVRQGCDVSLDEFKVTVEEETKKQTFSEMVTV